ncbi:hypothetical protein TURU_007286 [Turdus rufiventris]|nr:hypothetical protein TURU_007286 [Turdus rufiventris]
MPWPRGGEEEPRKACPGPVEGTLRGSGHRLAPERRHGGVAGIAQPCRVQAGLGARDALPARSLDLTLLYGKTILQDDVDYLLLLLKNFLCCVAPHNDFTDVLPDLQATWDPLILEQCQKIGFAEIVKTIEAAAPKLKYVKITQGPRETYLQFVEKVAAALEKQVEDNTVRQLLCKQLARDNANIDCLKII